MNTKYLVLLFATAFFFSCNSNSDTTDPSLSKKDSLPTSDSLFISYFQDTLTRAVYSNIKEIQKEGLAGGVDGYALMKLYPGIIPEDFTGVITKGGEYSVAEGKLVYTGNAASDSPVLLREGMKTFLQNITRRLNRPATSKEEVNQILAMIR